MAGAGRLADVANQMGVQQATPLLDDLSKGVANVASMLGGQVGGYGSLLLVS